MCTLSVSNVIYHKFSHGAAFYTLNGKNVNVMLEFTVKCSKFTITSEVYLRLSYKNKLNIKNFCLLPWMMELFKTGVNI